MQRLCQPRPPYQGLSLLFADLDRVEYSREVDNYDAWRALLTAEINACDALMMRRK